MKNKQNCYHYYYYHVTIKTVIMQRAKQVKDLDTKNNPLTT